MTHGLDTSVVMRLLTGDPRDQADLAAEFLTKARAAGERVLVSDIVLAEAYFALQAKYRVPKAEALLRLREFVESDEIEAGIAADVLQTPNLASAKPGFVDRLIHVGYEGEEARLVSFERSAGKLANTKVLA